MFYSPNIPIIWVISKTTTSITVHMSIGEIYNLVRWPEESCSQLTGDRHENQTFRITHNRRATAARHLCISRFVTRMSYDIRKTLEWHSRDIRATRIPDEILSKMILCMTYISVLIVCCCFPQEQIANQRRQFANQYRPCFSPRKTSSPRKTWAVLRGNDWQIFVVIIGV